MKYLHSRMVLSGLLRALGAQANVAVPRHRNAAEDLGFRVVGFGVWGLGFGV